MKKSVRPGSKLKKARLKADLTQKDLAEKLGVHVNYYARLERGEENPSLETLKKLTKILKVKSSDILSF
jgi:transcriptional regulator with XRE-family HTH domain